MGVIPCGQYLLEFPAVLLGECCDEGFCVVGIRISVGFLVGRKSVTVITLRSSWLNLLLIFTKSRILRSSKIKSSCVELTLGMGTNMTHHWLLWLILSRVINEVQHWRILRINLILFLKLKLVLYANPQTMTSEQTHKLGFSLHWYTLLGSKIVPTPCQNTITKWNRLCCCVLCQVALWKTLR